MFIYLIIGALSIGLLVLIIWLIKQHLFRKEVIHNFKKRNVIVDGKKGSGKDIVFQNVINARKDFYYSNISYGGKHKIISCNDISVYPNTYDNFINDNVVKVKRTFKEGKDIYISDGGIYLPSYMDSKLYKQYPSFPIYYALSRHLYNQNIHINTQNFNRVWKAIREQADFFIHVHKTIKLPFLLITKCTTYDKYESAIKYLTPVKKRFMNKYSTAELDIYNATNGEIKQGYIITWKHSIKYNTRAFEKILLKGKRKL